MTAKKRTPTDEKQDSGLSLLLQASNLPTGPGLVLRYMASMKIPMTREEYAATAYGEALEDLTPEQIASFPPGLK